jgi:hypothetical protein
MKNIWIILLLGSTTVFAQINGNGDGITTDTQAGIVIREVPIEGSRYMNELYKQGETVINGNQQTAALMRYDALNDAVELLDNNQQPRKLLRRKNIWAKFDGKTYAVLDYKEGNRVKEGYFNPLNVGKTVLLFKPKKMFRQAEKPDNGYDTYDPPAYLDISEYYLKKGDAPAQLIKLNKRNVLKAIGGNTTELKRYVAQYHLNLSKEEDVVRLLDYYNSIVPPAKNGSAGGGTSLGR